MTKQRPIPKTYLGDGVFVELSGAGGAHRPGLVHRLDQYTSGLVLIARNDQVHRQLSAAIERRDVKS